jgi:HSP20 family protein
MTKLVRFSPAVESRNLQNEFDRMFDHFFPGTTRAGTSTNWAPRLDFLEREDSYLVRMDAPGMEKGDFTVDFHDGTLTIGGERLAEDRDETDVMLRTERSYGRFTRSFALPRTVDEKKISATYSQGVLDIIVPKTEESKPRRIKIS